jgi:hypothetical protein
VIALFRRSYGAHPLHLLSLLACFALAGWAVLQASHGPLPLRMLVWFVAALLGPDLVLFPLYALLDKSLSTITGSAVNYVRVPALLSGLLLLLFFPVILRHSERTYGAASGLDESPFLARWLLLTGLAFLVSGVLYAIRATRSRQGS